MELTTLKTNNARLTAALQESTANVEEWKLQLQSYKASTRDTQTSPCDNGFVVVLVVQDLYLIRVGFSSRPATELS